LELRAAHFVETFGAAAVFGRLLTVQEMREMTVAMNVEAAYRSRERADNIAEWSIRNSASAEILSEAAHGE
jgi:hypothetical protein